MIVYNVTVNIENQVKEDWVSWMQHTHIPDVMSTGKFLSHRFLRLLNEEEHNTGTTFAIQYVCEDMHKLADYLENDAPALQQDHKARYENQFVAFRTILEEV